MATEERRLLKFTPERADIVIHATFHDEFWPLFHDVPAFYTALLRELVDFGVNANGIRTDVGDGSLGDYNVNFWVMNVRALVRIRLQQFEIRFNGITDSDADALEQALTHLVKSMRLAKERFEVRSWGIDLGMHGDITGVSTTDYLASFVGQRPELPGPFIGAGVVFYFGEQGSATLRTITTDLSGALTGKLYVRINALFKNLEVQALRSAVNDNTAQSLKAIGLTTEGES